MNKTGHPQFSWQRAFGALSFAVILTGLLSLAACKKSDNGDSGGGGGTIAATPCTATCNNTVYSGIPGLATPTAYTYGINSGFCGCAYGTRPIYHPQWGFACVQANAMTYGGYFGYNSNTIYQSQNVAALNMQQINYAPVQYGGDNNCFSAVAASCDVRLAGSCTNGGYCRPIGGGSSVGVCTTGQGIDNYNSGATPYSFDSNPYYYNNYYGNPYSGYGNNCSYRPTRWGGYVYSCSYSDSTVYSGGIPR